MQRIKYFELQIKVEDYKTKLTVRANVLKQYTFFNVYKMYCQQDDDVLHDNESFIMLFKFVYEI